MLRKTWLLLALGGTLHAGYDAGSVAGEWLINSYKAVISPLQGPTICNFWPTCSQFTRTSIRQYGLIPGMVMGADRLTRCNTFAWTYEGSYYYEGVDRLILVKTLR